MAKIDLNFIVERILQESKKKGVKNEGDIALGIGRSPSWWTKVKKKEINLSVPKLIEIADFLDIDMHLLCSSESEKENKNSQDESIDEKIRRIFREEMEVLIEKK